MNGRQYLCPQTMGEAAEIMGKYGSGVKILAGGTDVLIGLREGWVKCDVIMDIKKIKEAGEIICDENGLSIGAGVCLSDVIDAELPECYRILQAASQTLANATLRNRATLAGNLCNASPGADMAPASLVLGGVLVAVSPRGSREIPLQEFFTGVKRNCLAEDEFVVKAVFPPIKGRGVYLKKQRISGHDLSQVGVAIFKDENAGLNIAFGAVGPTPLMFKLAKGVSADEAVKTALETINPISDQRATREYRLAMAEYLLRKGLDEIVSLTEVS